MNKKSKGKLDVVTFFYGFGAAVVLLGSMFKFVGWDYANELFVIGLTVEILVFLISAFERNTEDKEYNWETVFPQLTSGEDSQIQNMESFQTAMQQFSKTITDLSAQVSGLNQTIGSMKGEMDSNLQASKEMHEKVNEFNSQVGQYNASMEQINKKYKEFLAGNQS